MRTVEQEALDLAALIGRARRRDQRVLGVVLPQPSTLEPLDETEPEWLNRALWVGLAAFALGAGVVWTCGPVVAP